MCPKTSGCGRHTIISINTTLVFNDAKEKKNERVYSKKNTRVSFL
jgi:hypothetical protein